MNYHPRSARPHLGSGDILVADLYEEGDRNVAPPHLISGEDA